MITPFLSETIISFDSSAQSYTDRIGKLDNYNHTYDALIAAIPDNSRVLDLACGPGNISAYLLSKKSIHVTGFDLSPAMLDLAKEKIPHGTFVQQSIDEFNTDEKYDLVINGFGLPYLDAHAAATSIASSAASMIQGGLFYLSFMEGNREGFEIPSFNPSVRIYIYYHSVFEIKKHLEQNRLTIINDWNLGYTETDGSITRDIILLARKNN